jgi:hypothetical protein
VWLVLDLAVAAWADGAGGAITSSGMLPGSVEAQAMVRSDSPCRGVARLDPEARAEREKGGANQP